MITIIDYGMGNLKSVYNALKKVNFDCQISSEVTDIEMADKLILPGVGAFKDAMDNLQNLDLILPIRKKVNDGCPLLGICLGMQMLFDEGYECELRKGLGFIEGKIKLMNSKENLKVPHIGWNRLEFNRENKILNNINKESFVYYVHSFMATEMIDENLIAYSKYGDINIPGIVNKGNVYGMQFHPEKSGEVGLKILKNFGVLSK
ncbi:imidazole glycerol phosphate synthase subunit HisH [uncultured Clostridium sp.]|uniref:imidazole glycerol phosphate synthase subunit HisH n=1 Tax=uncultured Clostridium sp. TaxID=59620 RepID=UPI0025CFD73F|nr:imidazole glycerol phosphate synthase subunit HisH [uncultured Clostridium sp.]